MPTYAVTIVHNSTGKREEIEVTAPTVDDAESIAALRPNVTVGRVQVIDDIGFRHKPEPQTDQAGQPAARAAQPVDTGSCTVLTIIMALLAVTGALTVAAGLSADITVGNTVNLGLVADRTSTILIGCALGIAGLVGISLGVAAKAVARSMSAR